MIIDLSVNTGALRQATARQVLHLLGTSISVMKPVGFTYELTLVKSQSKRLTFTSNFIKGKFLTKPTQSSTSESP